MHELSFRAGMDGGSVTADHTSVTWTGQPSAALTPITGEEPMNELLRSTICIRGPRF